MESSVLIVVAASLTAVAGILTAIGVIWKKGVVPAWRKGRSAVRMIHRVTVAADRLLPFAEQQLQPNGGSSLKDQMNRIETDVKGHSLRLEEIGKDVRTSFSRNEQRHKENVDRFEAVEHRLDAIESRLDREVRNDG